MRQLPYRIFIALFFLLIQIKTGYAGDTLYGKHPSALLVQLPTERNRIAAFTKNNDAAALNQVKKDVAGIRKAMTYDFAKNFNYCPVYYYTDTNVALVRQKRFEGI